MAQGDDKRFRVNVVDQNGTPVDISSSTEIVFKIANRVRSPAILTKSLTTGTILIGVNSQFYFDISDTESANLPPGNLYCEARITNSDGDRQTVGAGRFTVQDTL